MMRDHPQPVPPVTAGHKPPVELVIRWCPICGRHDRAHNLPARHLAPRVGRSCGGEPVTLTYRLA
jgi:hypothetical protein